MAYEATLAARISQFKETELEFNLSDADGIMPERRVTSRFAVEAPDDKEIEIRIQALIDAATEEFLTQKEEENAPPPEDTVLDRIDDQVNALLSVLQSKAESAKDQEVVSRINKFFGDLKTEADAAVDAAATVGEVKAVAAVETKSIQVAIKK